MKVCSMCSLSKEYSEYQRKSSAPDGHNSACKTCVSSRRIANRIAKGLRRPDPSPGYKWCSRCDTEKLLDEFYRRMSGPHEGKPHSHCKACLKADNIARARKRGVRAWQPADPNGARRRRLAQHYKLTLEQYDRLMIDQQGRCVGCDVEHQPGLDHFAVDHNHACCPGKVSCGRCIRGLLCRSCNFVLGHAFDDPGVLRRLATYLDAYASAQPSGS